MHPARVGAIVMASGVVSVDLYSVHQTVLSAIMLCFAAAAWLLLVVVLAAPLVYQRGRFGREASSPAGFTGVAATAVLGTRLAFADYRPPPRRCWRWRESAGPSCGAGPAALGNPHDRDLLCRRRRHRQPGPAQRRPGRQLPRGLAGQRRRPAPAARAGPLRLHRRPVRPAPADQRARRPLDRGRRAGHLRPRRRTRHPGRRNAWTIQPPARGPDHRHAGAVVPVHGVAPSPDRRRGPQAPAGYDLRRWATVLSLGVYAACSFTIGEVAGIAGITDFGHAWTWVAFTGGLVVLAGLLRHSWTVLRGQS